MEGRACCEAYQAIIAGSNALALLHHSLGPIYRGGAVGLSL
jgi:hypothetical protein